MPDDLSTQVDYQSACEQLMIEGFPCPPIPRKWSLCLHQVPCTAVFTTRPELPSPYFFQYYQQQMLEGQYQPMVAFGVCGHGVGSMAMHYYLLESNIVVLLQDALPDEPGDWSSQRQQDYESISALVIASQDAVLRGKLSTDEKIVICRSLSTPPQWGVVDSGGSRRIWESTSSPLESIINWLVD